jgi:hypothetical protein
MSQTSAWVSIPAHAIEGAAMDLAAALDYLAEGKVEEAQSCLVYPWTVLDTAEQAIDEIAYPDGGETTVELFDQHRRCKVCGHLEGDHEVISPGVYTCDDDCDEDLNGYCHVGRL